jgi:leucyl-tRNA synthetase
VTKDIDAFKFNTAVAALMEFVNTLWAYRQRFGVTPAFREAASQMLLLLAPFAPHITEELWACQGKAYSIHQQAWPEYDPDLTVDETICLVVQVNGKVRDRIVVPADLSDAEARTRALESKPVQRQLKGQQPKRAVVVPGRLVNLVS